MIDVARIFNSMLDRSGDSGHPYFIDLKINTFSFWPLSMMLAVGLLYMVCYAEVCSLYTKFLENF